MGTEYTSQSATGYNSSPPSDDGTVAESNKIKYSVVKTKLTDPPKDLADNINTQLVAHFDRGPTALNTTTTVAASHFNELLELSGTINLDMTDAGTLGAGFFCEMVNTDTTNSQTITRATATDTIDGVTANATIPPLSSLKIWVNAAANGFVTRNRDRTTTRGDILVRNSSNNLERLAVGSANERVYSDGTDVKYGYPSGSLVQVVTAQDGAVATGTTTMPDDDTIPQNTEGDEYITLSITPKNTNNKLVITYNGVSDNGGSSISIVALFQDSTANALAAVRMNDSTSVSTGGGRTLVHTMTAGTTSATTFKIRIGSPTAGTTTFNGTGGARKFGGACASTLTIMEIAA